jgi:hypothetical protein
LLLIVLSVALRHHGCLFTGVTRRGWDLKVWWQVFLDLRFDRPLLCYAAFDTHRNTDSNSATQYARFNERNQRQTSRIQILEYESIRHSTIPWPPTGCECDVIPLCNPTLPCANPRIYISPHDDGI